MGGAYPKILHLGDKPIADLFDGPVEITEKLDGSQFSFGKINNTLYARSKGKDQDLDNPDKMFIEGVEYVKSIADKIPNGFQFWGEYLQKPRHNVLAYDLIPKNNIALFGVQKDGEMFGHDIIKYWADMLKVDAVPLIFEGQTTVEDAIKLVGTKSYLGGAEAEGIVVKRYEPWMFLGKILSPVKAGKYVTEKFKEVHHRDWAKLNTAKGAFGTLAQSVRTEARWQKAIQHLRDDGNFTGTVQDIGKIIVEIQRDLADEEKENLKNQLWRIYGGDILKSATSGFVDWYKENIAKGEYQDV